MFGSQEEFQQTFDQAFGNIEKMKKTAERVNERMKDNVYLVDISPRLYLSLESNHFLGSLHPRIPLDV